MNNMSSYCGLVDEKIRASDKDLPVQKRSEASKTTPGTSQKIWHTSTFWNVLCHGCGFNHGRDYVRTHHMFSRILNCFLFLRKKNISDENNSYTGNPQLVLFFGPKHYRNNRTNRTLI